uniref:Ferlin_C domain-containing protein n=1 Tax=Heterorhabditis bacteriophora TaxID=37862 RepID=A0A1I7XQ15_HETBA
MSDLYVKTFISGAVKSQKTDVHYRSIDGCGEFNWRFVMDIKYNPWEKKIMNYQKSRLFGKRQENLVEPLLTVQLWDKNKLKTDTLLGEMVFDITNFKEGIADPEDLTVYVQKRRSRRLRCCTAMCNSICFCLFSKHNCCCCCTRNMKQQSLPRAPRYRPPGDDFDSISLFDSGSVRGWWPVLTSICDREMQKDDLTGQKKKNDDFDKLQQYVTGLLEMEISLASAEEALFEPVGRGRKEPNHSPFLPKPYRNKWNYFWLTSSSVSYLRYCVDGNLLMCNIYK